MTLCFEYRYLFDGDRPEIDHILKNVPSRFVIGILATINDTLDIRGETPDTQWFILKSLSVNFTELERLRILRIAYPLINRGVVLFAHRFTVDLINHELLHFREDNVQIEENFAEDEYNLFKAYLCTIDVLNTIDAQQMGPELRNAAELGGKHLVRVMWPHILKQHEFNMRPNAIIETHRGQALMAFLERHAKFSQYTNTYYQTLGCNSGQEYIRVLLGLAVPNLQREPSDNPMDYFFRIRVDKSEPVLESLVITSEYVLQDASRQIDYRGLKEKPLFNFQPGEFIVPHWDYLYNALNLGVIFSFYNDSGVSAEIADLGTFKGILGRDFSENVLFRNTMTKCFSRKYESLEFFENNNPFNPDCYYRRGNHIFVIEFKDYLLNSEVIQSGSYEAIERAVNEKFVEAEVVQNGKTRIKAKGVSQLATNLNYLVNNPDAFWGIDVLAKNKKLKLRNMIIHPIIVQTSIYFDFPALNAHLDDIFQHKIDKIREDFRSVEPLTLIHFDYFFGKLLQFADGRLHLEDELNYYHDELMRRKKKAERTRNENDWFQSCVPFSYVNSPSANKEYMYRKYDLISEIRSCWNIPE